MAMSLIQYRKPSGVRGVAVIKDGGTPLELDNIESVCALAEEAISLSVTLAELVGLLPHAEPIVLSEVTLLPPIDHDDSAHLVMTGTGLTHLGSAEGRDTMHQKTNDSGIVTDSMKMFLMGVEGGKPVAGHGAQPEWFYKGDGSQLVGPGETLLSPEFGQDAGEEPEIAGIYLIGADGNPVRLGYALANEFSDHVTEQGNYLWLAHSKLRPAALGAELLISGLPSHVEGLSRILRGGRVIWEKPFLSGEANMSHSLDNLEHHHFKYTLFRRPGDIHIHFFGTATLSFSDGICTQEGDVFEISASPFSLPVSNPIAHAPAVNVKVTAL